MFTHKAIKMPARHALHNSSHESRGSPFLIWGGALLFESGGPLDVEFVCQLSVSYSESNSSVCAVSQIQCSQNLNVVYEQVEAQMIGKKILPLLLLFDGQNTWPNVRLLCIVVPMVLLEKMLSICCLCQLAKFHAGRGAWTDTQPTAVTAL